MSRKTHRKALAKLDALYARLPTIACRGLCSEACGPIPATTLEADRLHAADPQRRRLRVLRDATCVYLTPSQRCGVYAVRPLICRVFGLVKRMSCMHGCLPDRWLSDHEFLALAQAVERLGGSWQASGPEGPVPVESFLDIDPSGGPDEATADRLAEHTRALRAMHGGRVVGVAPGGPGGWVSVDKAPR